MMRLRTWAPIVLIAAAALLAVPAVLHAQQYVVFKVKSPFDTGRTVPDTARMNDYYAKVGSEDGVQIGMVLNVYRDQEIEAEFGNFVIRTRLFIGRMRAFEVHRDYTVARVVELATFSNPHRERDAVMVKDYVQPVFVVASENLFDKGSSTLRPEAIQELDRAAAFIRRFRPTKVRIEGHTDAEGEEDYNLTLSESRAISVKDYLVSQGGLDENLFITVGYGESKPIATNDTPEGQRKNRRFEIVIEN